MRWRKITKDSSRVPTSGTYKDWKELLAIEGHFQCVYCAIHESCMGGTRNFHVEHYRPKSLFTHLEHDYTNLYYACPICNSFKGNDWPCEPVMDFSVACYPCPSEVDYCDLFEFAQQHGSLRGKNITATYMIERLNLNRPQLIIERRFSVIRDRLTSSIQQAEQLIPALMADDRAEARNHLGLLALHMARISDLYNRSFSIRPYESHEMERP